MSRDDDIITLSQKHPLRGQSMLTQLETYWRDLRGARQLPRRTSIDPTRIDAALPYAFILERVAQGVARIRVSGQKVNELIGSDGRGMTLATLFGTGSGSVLAEYLEELFDTPAIVELPLLSPRSLIRPKLTGRLIMLPLEGADGRATRALGAMLIDGAQGRSPRRFDIPLDGTLRCEPVPAARPRLAVNAPGTHRSVAARHTLRLVVSNG
jgi:hypothetical protein